MLPKIIYEDNHIIVLEKYPGLLSQGDETGHPNLIDIIKNYLKVKYHKPGEVYLGLLQRIDRPVGGLLILAKTSKAFTRLHDQIKERTVDKYYMAISDCRPPKVEDELINYMVKDEKINLSKVYENEVPGSKYARLHYKLIGSKDGKFLFQIKLITGRSHQIRAQMAHIGCPLLGDVKYGKSLPKPAYELCLYAYQVAFTHPVLKERMVWTNFPDPTGYWKGMDEFFPLLK
ncbi:MAG TPA: RluA family pseudouridine synthase [Saprospiraceae bacterium]|nr:RluA family pseudouridine synthase [Saprospiraceae bacterium]